MVCDLWTEVKAVRRTEVGVLIAIQDHGDV